MNEWRWIPGYEGEYQINKVGVVKSVARVDRRGWNIKERIMKQFLNNRGYYVVTLRGKDCRVVHRLVATVFLGEMPSYMEVNHINGIKTDNRLENLEWVTHQENIMHASRLGVMGKAKGERNGNACLTNEQVKLIRKKYKKRIVTCQMLAEENGCSKDTIRNVIKNKTYKEVL